MHNGQIKDSQITASTEFHTLETNNARINRSTKAWCATHNDANQWIQVNLGLTRLVTGVILQGRANKHEWVKKYKVQTSDDGKTWKYVKGANQDNEMVSKEHKELDFFK